MSEHEEGPSGEQPFGQPSDQPTVPRPPQPPPPNLSPTPPPPTAGGTPTGNPWPIVQAPEAYPELSPAVLPLPILAIMPARAKQRRWTVLLRFFLALPLSLVVFVIEIAAWVCVVLGWFFAIVMGRAPAFTRTIVTLYLRLQLRLYSYLFLLTDQFPPFETEEEPGYGTRLAVPPATKLNRAAVVFRFILVIPASIAIGITHLGVQIVAFFMWFVVLITGWLPKPVHEVYAAFIRYELRITGYFYLLVPTYPGELFGDLEALEPVPTPGAPAFGGSPPAPPAPTFVPNAAAVPPPPPPYLSPSVSPPPPYVSSSAPPPPPYLSPSVPPPPSSGQQPWMLILSMGAKRLLIGVIVLGVAAAIGWGILEASLQNQQDLVQVNNQLVTNLNQFSATVKDCGTVSCLEQADSTLSQQLGSFVGTLQSSDGGGVSQGTIDQMIAAAQNTQQVTSTLSDAGPSVSAYRARATKLNLQQSFTNLFNAQHQFVQQVNAARLG
jgi:Domain of unknown function (DUF4389)